MSQNLNTELLEFSTEHGVDLLGVADVKKITGNRNLIPDTIQSTLSRAVVTAVRLSSSILSEIKDKPTKTYFHHYRTVNMALDQLALKLTGFLQVAGYQAFPVPASQLLDWDAQLGLLSHKHAAVEAGLGWIGRNNLLVTPQCGSQVRLVSVLTDASLEYGVPLNEDCGSCRACIPVCPCQAISDDPAEFNHKRCYDQLDHFVRKRVVGQHICGVCVRACSPEQVTKR